MKALPKLSRRAPLLAALFSAAFPLAAPEARAAELAVDLIEWGDTWKYDDTNTDLDFDWIDLDYDDSGWAEGPAQLGFGDNPPDEATKLTKGSTTFYFRKYFTVTQAQIDQLEIDGFFQLVIGLKYDDGAVIHINGFEDLARVNMPSTAIEHTTRSSGNAENTVVEITVEGTGLLEPGDNVLAVEIHQSSPGSSDMSFDLELDAFREPPTFGVYIPPQVVTFDIGGLSGALDYNPNKGDPEIGWFGNWPNGQNPPASIGAFDSNPVDGEPVEGFLNGNCYLINKRRGWLTSRDPSTDPRDLLKYRIDTRKFTNVEVSYDVRAFDDNTGGFETSDYFEYISITSQNGQDYTETKEKLVGNATRMTGGPFEGGGTVVFDEDQAKTALVPTAADHAVIGDSWRQPGFDDSSWHAFSGGGVGYEASSNPGANNYRPHFAYDTQAIMRNRNTTCYVRIPFTVDNPAEIETLRLLTRDDDGFSAFLNGEHVFGFKAPPPDDLTWDSAAVGGDHSDPLAINLKPRNLDAHIGKLVAGENLLAVQALNVSRGSSDFLFSCKLEITTDDGGIQRRDPPVNLNDINFGLDGGFYRFTHQIPDSVSSYLWRWEVNTNEDLEMLMFDNWSITGTPDEVLSYESYILLEHPDLDLQEDGDRNADADGDGIVNYLEYAFGSDPEVFGHTVPGDIPRDENGDPTGPQGPPLPILPQIELFEDEGDGLMYFHLTWRQLNVGTKDSLEFPDGGYTVRDLKYIPQFSDDLFNWQDQTASLGVFEPYGEAVEHDDGTISYTARYSEPILVPGFERPLYGRVLVEDAQPFIE